MVLRGAHYFLGHIDWLGLGYVDDLKVDMLEAGFWDALAMLAAYFLAMGVPVSWRKFRVSGDGVVALCCG